VLQFGAPTRKPANRRRAYRFFGLALILLTFALALPAGAFAFREGGGGASEVWVAHASGLGTIVVDSAPTRADVRVDGVDAGRSTPATFASLSPGEHRVSVTIPGFQTWERTVTVAGDATTNVQAALVVALPETVSAEVVVTTTSDGADGDDSSIAALQACPGPDGISLREALNAANRTPGTKVIRFAAALHDAVITVGLVTADRLPWLDGENIWIIGDIDGDGTPDVTLDGRLFHESVGHPNSKGIAMTSGGDVISGLRFVNFAGDGIMVGEPDGSSPADIIADQRVLGNSIEGGQGIAAGSVALTRSRLIIAGNQVTLTSVMTGDSPAAIAVCGGSGNSHDNRILDTSIASNTLTNGVGIGVTAGDANTQWMGIPGPIGYAEHISVQGLTIDHNQCLNTAFIGITVCAANFGNSDCAISDVMVRDNDISFADSHGGLIIGIRLEAGEMAFNAGEQATARNALTHVAVERNRIEGAWIGIVVSASYGWDWAAHPLAGGGAENVISDVVIAGNEVRDSKECGIDANASVALGQPPCRDSTLSGLVISGNLIANDATQGVGIRLVAGMSGDEGASVVGNAVTDAVITDNTVTGFEQGIWIAGGYLPGAVGNTLTGSSSGNSVTANEPWRIAADSEGASGNTVTFDAAELDSPVPMIAKLKPASAKRGATVTISGSGFGTNSAARSVKFGTAKCASYVSWSDAQIKCKVPAKAKYGKISVTVTTAGGVSNAVSFTVKR